jgi:hypothetical protein
VGPTITTSANRHYSKSNRLIRTLDFQGDSLLQSQELTFEDHGHSHSDDTWLGADFEYHRPIGMRLQADAQSQLQYNDRQHLIQGTSAVQIDYIIADRWFADARASHSIYELEVDQEGTLPQWTVNYSASLSYWLEDSWSIGLILMGAQQHTRDRFDRQAGFQLGFTYRIAGTLEAPGVIEPQRLSPLRD